TEAGDRHSDVSGGAASGYTQSVFNRSVVALLARRGIRAARRFVSGSRSDIGHWYTTGVHSDDICIALCCIGSNRNWIWAISSGEGGAARPGSRAPTWNHIRVV